MDKLGALEAKIADLTFGELGFDFFLVLSHFFSQQEIMDRMVYLNQSQLYNGTLADGSTTPAYSPLTIEKRRSWGLRITPNYTYHEFGDLYRSMGVKVGDDGVMLICDPNSSEGMVGTDFMGDTTQSMSIEGDTHIEDMFNIYDPNREGLGLTEENLLTLREDMVAYVQDELRNFILNG